MSHAQASSPIADYTEVLFSALYMGIMIFLFLGIAPLYHEPFTWKNILGLITVSAFTVAPAIEIDRKNPSIFSLPCYWLSHFGRILGGG